MKALEDVGFYCVDNLPVVLLEPFVELFREGSNRLAVVIDVREGSFLDSFPAVYDGLHRNGINCELLFLEASDDFNGFPVAYPGYQGGFGNENSATLIRFQWQLAL